MSAVDDEFDHDDPTIVDKGKDAVSKQRELERLAIVDLTTRVTALEDQVSHLRELVRQLIERVEELTTEVVAAKKKTDG